MNVIEQFEQIGIIPVVVLNDVDKAIPLAEALISGGLPCAEVTFRTAAAKESIKRIRNEYPDMLVGAGTVRSIKQVDEAIEAGAQFIVTPGFNENIVKYCIEKNIPITPGCMDTYAIERASDLGIETIKFFPAEAAGGTKMIKALSGPYPNLRFIPTGGINAENLKEYLSIKQIVACGGSWMVKSNLIDEDKFDEIKKMTQEAVKLVEDIRGGK